MDPLETIQLPAQNFSCPICYQRYGLISYHPVSLNCGHVICSHCLLKVRSCPLCRFVISKRALYKKDAFISNIIEKQEKLQECKDHRRPLEFFCKKDQKFFCIDCGVENNHFKHSFLKCKDIETKVDKMKKFVKDIDVNLEESSQSLKKFLTTENVSLKRKIDQVLDEYMEPMFALKKKLKKNIDTYFITQEVSFEKEVSNDSFLKNKKERDVIFSKWENSMDEHAADQIINYDVSEIEQKVNDAETRLKNLENEIKKTSNNIFQDMKLKIAGMNKPLERAYAKLKPTETLKGSLMFLNFEKDYFIDYLNNHGIPVIWRKVDKTVCMKENNQDADLKDLEVSDYNCTLKRIHFDCPTLFPLQLLILCKVIESTSKLLDFSLHLHEQILDSEILLLGESISKIISLKRLGLTVSIENTCERSLSTLWFIISSLPNIKILNFHLKNSKISMNRTIKDIPTFPAPSTADNLKEISVCFSQCHLASRTNLKHLLQSLQELKNLNKLSLSIIQCHDSSKEELFDLVQMYFPPCPKLKNVAFIFEDLSLSMNPEKVFCSTKVLINAPELERFQFSFAGNELSSPLTKKFVKKTTMKLTGLRELNIDFSRCKNVEDDSFESLMIAISRLTQLTKLILKFQKCDITEKGILALSTNLAKLENLASITVDCRKCKMLNLADGDKPMQYLNSLTRPTIKEFLFDQEKEEDTEREHGSERTSQDSNENRFSQFEDMFYSESDIWN